jgi:hypothetical protein
LSASKLSNGSIPMFTSFSFNIFTCEVGTRQQRGGEGRKLGEAPSDPLRVQARRADAQGYPWRRLAAWRDRRQLQESSRHGAEEYG